MWKKQKRCLRMESSLPHHVLECIMERLPVKSLLRFKVVSNEWKSTIESREFQERQLKHRQQSGDPHVLLVSEDTKTTYIDYLRTVEIRSSLASVMKIPAPWLRHSSYQVCRTSLDGLVCLYNTHGSGFVVNPATRWYRPLPLCSLQQLMIHLGVPYFRLGHAYSAPGFGKDKFTGTYKVVWLYNSSEISREHATTCEVFDFSTNAWRYVTPSAPYRLIGTGCHEPVFVDGSLHWFTECQETKVLSFDLHTQAFQVIAKAPFSDVHPYNIAMCNLDNRLCVSEMNGPNQLIWSFNSGNKTWDKMFSIDLSATSTSFDIPRICALLPLALLHGDKKKNKLLFTDLEIKKTLVTLDPQTESYNGVFFVHSMGYSVCYFQSLISLS